MKTRIALRKLRPQGFSLPEVTLALGIAAFGITTILGLLPQGLSNIRKAGDVTAASRISQHVLAALDQTIAADATARRYYFDAYAVPVDPEGIKKDEIAYVAEVAPPVADLSLPGTPKSNDAFLQRVNVRVKQTPAVDYNFNEAQNSSYKLYSYVVAKTGK